MYRYSGSALCKFVLLSKATIKIKIFCTAFIHFQTFSKKNAGVFMHIFINDLNKQMVVK